MSQTRRPARRSIPAEEWDHVLAQLRRDGFSPIESIKITRAVLGVGLGEAKSIVHRSDAWSDARVGFEQLQDAAIEATEQLR